jgi:hypothetical protein
MHEFFLNDAAFCEDLRQPRPPGLCWSCAGADRHLVFVPVGKDLRCLGLPSAGCPEQILLCPPCAAGYMNSFNQRLGDPYRWSEFPPEFLELMDRDRAHAGPDLFIAFGIDQIVRAGDNKKRRGRSAPRSGRGSSFACETLAEALERLRSGLWLRPSNN